GVARCAGRRRGGPWALVYRGQHGAQRAQVRLVVRAAVDRRAVDRAADLLGAEGDDRVAAFVEAQTCGVPLQPRVVEDAAGLRLGVGGDVFVVDLKRLAGQQTVPVAHDARIFVVVHA